MSLVCPVRTDHSIYCLCIVRLTIRLTPLTLKSLNGRKNENQYGLGKMLNNQRMPKSQYDVMHVGLLEPRPRAI